jgi:branched-chain amino acid transport system permease protein
MNGHHKAMRNFERYLSSLGSLLLLFLLILLPTWSGTYYLSLVISVFLYVVLTVSWSMFCALTGYMSLASAAFFGVGAYTTAVFGDAVPTAVVFLTGGVYSSLLALLVGLSCLRLKGVYFSIFTFGLSELILNAILFYEMEVTGTVGRMVKDIDETQAYWAMLSVVVSLLISVQILKRSKYGLALQSIGQSELAAECMGVNVNALKVTIFVLSAFFMGIAGAIMVTQWTYVDPRTAFNVFYSFMPVLMAIFGGVEKIRGQIIGAIVLTLLAESLLIRFPYLYMLIFGILVLLVILFFPKGLIGIIEPRRKWVARSRGA